MISCSSQEIMDRTRHVLLKPLILGSITILSLDLLDNQVLVRAQSYQSGYNPSADVVSNFQPSLAVVIGVLSIMFSVTFVLLIYAKFCHRGGWANPNSSEGTDQNALTRSRRFSGIDKTVIESLPFFRFSSLKGSRAGLECSVCLSKFEDVEILRLLPKCKHGFHIDCIDHWLERHSTCPLCRHRVSRDDVSIFAYSNSMRMMTSSNRSERISLDPLDSPEMFIEREEERTNASSSMRFNIGSSFRKLFKGSNNHNSNNSNSISKDEESLINNEKKELHKFNHKIVVSDIVFQNRWSNVSSSDLMFLNSEMLNTFSSDRFLPLEPYDGDHVAGNRTVGDMGKIKEEMDRKRVFESKINKTGLISSGSGIQGDKLAPTNGSSIVSEVEKRSRSEITGLTRFKGLDAESRFSSSSSSRKEERRREIWIPIARRTVQWFANRERRNPNQSLPL